MKTYSVKKINHLIDWDNVEAAKIDLFNWARFTGYDPEAEFKMVHDENNIYIRLTSYKDYIVSECMNINDIVCCDSCMEAFIIAPGKSQAYYNFEFNSNGILHLGYGPSRNGRIIVDPDIIRKYVTVTVEKDIIPQNERGKWQITAIINKGIFEEMSGEKFEDGLGKGGFYKCGDRVISHFITWNKIETDHPDFHRPEFFGNLIFES